MDALEAERPALKGLQLLGDVGVADIVILEEDAQPNHAVGISCRGGDGQLGWWS
ncbi:MAG: hypothetical protein ACLU98_07105 [Desulfovibrio fairfieldensis]